MPALLTPTNSYINTVWSSGVSFSFSFWFYDDGEILQSKEEFLGKGGGNNNQVYASTALSWLEFRAWGYLATYDSNIVTPNSTGFKVNYDKKRLNHFVYLKDTSGVSQIYLNGALIGTGTTTGNNNYPAEILGNIGNQSCPISLGDMAYWDQDISDIIPEVYSNGSESNWMDLSKKPYHYWRLGKSQGTGTILDVGTDGNKDFTFSGPLKSRSYTLVSGDGSNYTFSGDATGSDPILNVIVGDTLTFTNSTGGHPLAIKNSLGVDVATESSGTTTWAPTTAGKYTYYCTSHPADMKGDINVNEVAEYRPVLSTVAV